MELKLKSLNIHFEIFAHIISSYPSLCDCASNDVGIYGRCFDMDFNTLV